MSDQLDLFGQPAKGVESVDATPEPPTVNSPSDGRCIVIGCLCASERTLVGHEVCQKHDTTIVAAILDSGAYPGQFHYAGKESVSPTKRRLEEPLNGKECLPGGLFDQGGDHG